MHLTNTVWGFMLPAISTPFLIMMFRQNSRNFPVDIMEAARIDGLSEFGIFFKMYMPVQRSTYAAAAVITFMNAWNSYMWPQLVNSAEWRLVSNWMASCGITSEGVDYPMKMAAALIVSIPLFIVFIFFRKYIMKGVSKSGIKG